MNLDDLEHFQAIDSANRLAQIDSASEKFAHGWDEDRFIGDDPHLGRMFESIVITPADLAETIPILHEGRALYGADVPAVQNSAKRLAGQFMNRLPVILGAGPGFFIAQHWKDQIARNAKSWAQAEDTDQIAEHGGGLMFPEFLTRRMHCAFLSTPGQLVGADHQTQTVYHFFLQNGLVVDQITGRGTSALAQAMSLIQYGDYVSYYLAMAYGVDPTPTLIHLSNS